MDGAGLVTEAGAKAVAPMLKHFFAVWTSVAFMVCLEWTAFVTSVTAGLGPVPLRCGSLPFATELLTGVANPGTLGPASMLMVDVGFGGCAWAAEIVTTGSVGCALERVVLTVGTIDCAGAAILIAVRFEENLYGSSVVDDSKQVDGATGDCAMDDGAGLEIVDVVAALRGTACCSRSAVGVLSAVETYAGLGVLADEGTWAAAALAFSADRR
jgi:hypothetical protein